MKTTRSIGELGERQSIGSRKYGVRLVRHGPGSAAALPEFGPVAQELKALMRPGSAAFDLSVAARMVFSCLVDADFRDTEAFYAALNGTQPERDWPILMGATMIIQMRLTPQPTVDNAQAKMFKFMPYFFALICYNFSCALSLYSTINGLFTIVQQIIINRMKDPEPVAAVATGGGRRGMKNVTPKK